MTLLQHAGGDRASAQPGELAPDAAGANEIVPPKVKHVIGPDGRRLRLADLPTPGTKRWVIRRKAEVVAAVRGGLLSLEEACNRYALNSEELMSWQRRLDRFGVAGLGMPRMQFYLQRIASAEERVQH